MSDKLEIMPNIEYDKRYNELEPPKKRHWCHIAKRRDYRPYLLRRKS